MTDSIEAMTPHVDQQELAEQLVEQARADGVELIGPGGLLTGLTSKVLNTALDVEMAEHLGYDKHDPAGRNGENTCHQRALPRLFAGICASKLGADVLRKA